MVPCRGLPESGSPWAVKSAPLMSVLRGFYPTCGPSLSYHITLRFVPGAARAILFTRSPLCPRITVRPSYGHTLTRWDQASPSRVYTLLRAWLIVPCELCPALFFFFYGPGRAWQLCQPPPVFLLVSIWGIYSNLKIPGPGAPGTPRRQGPPHRPPEGGG